MVIINWDLPNLSTDVLLKTLVINNTLPKNAKYFFISPLNIYLEGLINANVSGYINSRLIYTIPTEIRVYKDGVLDSTIPFAEIGYVGFSQTTKHARYINVSNPYIQVPFVQELYLGSMKYQFNQANINFSYTGTYTFRCTFVYSLYSDNTGGGSNFGSMNNYGVKTNPLVSSSNFYNGAYSNGSIDEIGFSGATTYLGYTKIADSFPLMCFPTTIQETFNSNKSRLVWVLNANGLDQIFYRRMPTTSLIRKVIINLDNTNPPLATASSAYISIFVYTAGALNIPSTIKYRTSGTTAISNTNYANFRCNTIHFEDNRADVVRASPYNEHPLPTDPIYGYNLDVDANGDVIPIKYDEQLFIWVCFSTNATSAANINSTLTVMNNDPIYDIYFRGWTQPSDY